MTPKAMRQWSTRLLNRADSVMARLRANPTVFSDRAIGEAQGYARALREVSARLERTANTEISRQVRDD